MLGDATGIPELTEPQSPLEEKSKGSGAFLREIKGGTEQQNRASFEREGGATWAGGRGRMGSAHTGGAARHAGQSAE
jgi:hypothetical protein